MAVLEAGRGEVTTEVGTKKPPPNTWILWVLANAGGHLLGLGAFGLLSLVVPWARLFDLPGGLFGYSWRTVLPLPVLGLLDGIGLGLVQGFLLQHYTRKPLLLAWTLVTGLAGAISWTAGFFFVFLTFHVLIFFMIVSGAFAGTMIGSLQSEVLRRFGLRQGGWTAINALTGGFGVSTGFLVLAMFVMFYYNPLASISPNKKLADIAVWGLLVSLGGAVYGAFTARAFVQIVTSLRDAPSRGY